MGGRGQVYVLDMGEPVRILDLAKQMIRLSGRREEDIPIVFTGSRAGEKVHEVLWNEGEAVGPTSHPKIMRAARPQIDAAGSTRSSTELERLVDEGDTLGVVAKLGTMVQSRRAAPAAQRCSKTRCTSDFVTVSSQLAAAGALRWLGGPARRPEPRAAARGRGGARPGLHPRGRRLGQDDDDHAAHRAAGRVRRVRADADHGGDLHRQGRGRAARAARGARRPAACAPATFHSAALRQLRHFAPGRVGPDPAVEGAALRQIANTLPAPFKFRPAGDLATEIEWAKNRRIGRRTLPRRGRQSASRRSRTT